MYVSRTYITHCTMIAGLDSSFAIVAGVHELILSLIV